MIETYRGRDDVKYRNLNGSTYPTIETYVNHIADVGTATINGTAIGKLSASNISSLTGGGTKPIVIHKGIIQRMDKFTGAQIQSNELSVTVKVWGGHSPASCIVTFTHKGREYVIAGDECYQRECLTEKRPTGSSFDKEKSRAFVETFSGEAYTVLMSHDPAILPGQNGHLKII